eukprot:4382124-Ditylum_brightwellii.AAC.1
MNEKTNWDIPLLDVEHSTAGNVNGSMAREQLQDVAIGDCVIEAFAAPSDPELRKCIHVHEFEKLCVPSACHWKWPNKKKLHH